MILGSSSEDLPEQTRHQLKTVDRSVTRLQKLVDQILDLSALEAGKVELRLQTSDICELVREQLDAFELAAQNMHVKLEFAVPKSPILWTFDQEKMEWILTNLLSNALKFSFEGGKIQVSVNRTPDNHLSIAVRDYGAGINPNDLPHILDRFYRGVSENTDIGSGIGLSILQELVQLHHGTVNVESELQKGSCFTILLPYLDVRVEKTPSGMRTTLSVQESVSPPLKLDIPSPAESSSDVAPSRDVILIAEDNVDLLAFIRVRL